MKEIRCAIYTRKSTEEGLDKEFNTLEAQREAGENYVLSQKHQGWKIIPEHYEDGGFSVFELNGFPGVYTKYVLKTLGADGILKLMDGVKNRIAKFISVATFVDKNGNIFQFEREGGEFEISKEKIDIQSPFAWSELWKIIYLKEYDKNLCELSEQEVSEYYGRIGANGSIQKFVKWYTNEYKR